jgi:hypothetical protein
MLASKRRGAAHGLLSDASANRSGAVFPVGKCTAGLLRTIDTDNDGTIDLNQAKAAAGRVFDWLERHNDGTLNARELKGPRPYGLS